MPQEEVLSNTSIALFALYKLGGVSKKIHTEYIAWEAFNLAKDKFSWSLPEFRERGFPDKVTVRYALEAAKKTKLVRGRGGKDKFGHESEGWKFTPAGADWMKEHVESIGKALKQATPLSALLQPHEAARFVKKIKSEKLFQEYRTTSELTNASKYDFVDMLNCSPDSSKDVIRQKFDIMKSVASLVNSKEIQEFLIKCEEKFKDVIS